MTKVVDDPYTLLGDQPYVGAHDPFGFDEVAVELEQLILRSRKSTPFTLGIEAPWGTGKSSLMGQLQRRLDARRDPAGPMVKTVSFNAWVAEGTDVLEGLVKSVLDAMDPSVLRRALRNERLMSVLGFAWRLVAAWLRLGSLADAAWDKLSVDAKTRNQINELVSKAMRDWAERAAKENGGPSAQRMLVVFIDDLDRCSPENVMKIFEAMKLYLSAPGLVFVIGYDDTIVSEAVLARKEYAKQVTGREYVEKVIQIVFRIPRPSGDQTQALVRTLVAQSGTAELLGETECTLLIDRNGRNPRRMKRFLNRFILDYRLDDASGTVRPELLIKLLILESYFPDFTRMMERSDSDAVAEFLDYQDVRTKLRRVEAPAANLAARVGDRYVMRFPSGELNAQQAAELVGQLDHAVPETLATLAQDADFVSLLESLRDPDDQRELREKVAGRVLTGTTAAEQPKMTATTAESATTTADLTALGGAHVVWIDDNPAATEREAGALREAGCRVEQFSDVADALPIVASDPPDVLVSDVTRGDRPYAGFDDLQRLRTEAGYEGPAVFYVARLSADRRDMATTLGATITSDMVELLRLVGEAHRPPPPEPTGRFKAREDGAPIPQ